MRVTPARQTTTKYLRNVGNQCFFLQNTGGFAFFFPPVHRYRRKMSGKISTQDRIITLIQTPWKSSCFFMWSRFHEFLSNQPMFIDFDCLVNATVMNLLMSRDIFVNEKVLFVLPKVYSIHHFDWRFGQNYYCSKRPNGVTPDCSPLSHLNECFWLGSPGFSTMVLVISGSHLNSGDNYVHDRALYSNIETTSSIILCK